ncbi:hypothetical protein Tco_1105327 [Tanacetum coccineum]
MSSMKNLDDTFNFGDQFLYDKPTEDDQEKSKVREESDSTIPDTNLIEKYSVLPGLESVKNQESENSPKEIIRAKKEQDEEKQDSTYSIRSTDKVDLENDLKSAFFNHMNKNKSTNRNTANYHLYHALMEALIADEDAMDKAKSFHTRLKTTRESLIVMMMKGPMMMMKALQLDQTRVGQQRKEDLIQPLLGQLNLFRKMMTKVQRNQGSQASASKQHPALTQQITTGKKSSGKADLEVPTFNLVKAYLHKNKRLSSFQIDECHMLLTNMNANMDISASMASFTGGLGEGIYINKHYRKFPPTLITKKQDPQKMISKSHPNDLKICFLLNIQEKLNAFLPIQTRPSLHKLQYNMWDKKLPSITSNKTIRTSLKPRAVFYRDRNDQRKADEADELNKFSDGTFDNKHPSETIVFHNEDGNPARANIKQALGYLKDGDGDGNSQYLPYGEMLGLGIEDGLDGTERGYQGR